MSQLMVTRDEAVEGLRFTPPVSVERSSREAIARVREHLAAPARSGHITLERLFQQLVAEWHEDTRFQSSTDVLAAHPSFLRIIGLGHRILPLVLSSYSRELDHWYLALRPLTGVDPVPESDLGDLDRMREAWLAWARHEGYQF